MVSSPKGKHLNWKLEKKHGQIKKRHNNRVGVGRLGEQDTVGTVSCPLITPVQSEEHFNVYLSELFRFNFTKRKIVIFYRTITK